MSFKIKNSTDSNKRVVLKANQDFLPSVEGETNVTTILTANALSFCLSPTQLNIISCEGATNTLPINIDTAIYEMGASLERAYLDGIEIFEFSEGGWLDITYASDHKVVTDFDNAHFKNVDTVNHRLEFVFSGSQALTANFLFPNNTNPTLSVSSVPGTYNGGSQQGFITTVRFCLASTAQNQISCEGATNSARFTDGSGTWDIEVNGTTYYNLNEYGLGYFISSDPFLSSILEAGGDGDFMINSLSTSDNLRIRLLRKDSDPWEINESNPNPTISIDFDGNISFCLAPVQPIISCEGYPPYHEIQSVDY